MGEGEDEEDILGFLERANGLFRELLGLHLDWEEGDPFWPPVPPSHRPWSWLPWQGLGEALQEEVEAPGESATAIQHLRAKVSPQDLRYFMTRLQPRHKDDSESSTLIMQPLDVSVFGPMKRHQPTLERRLSSTWKDECECKAENFATVPKQTLWKSYSPVVRSGFKATILYSYSLKKVLWNLPEIVEERDAQSDVQQTLLQTLLNKRYNAPANTAAARSKGTKRTRDCVRLSTWMMGGSLFLRLRGEPQLESFHTHTSSFWRR